MDIKAVLGQIKEQLGKLNKRTKRLLAALLAVVVVASIVLAVLLNNTEYTTLFTNLNSTEASEIMGKLSEMDVPYKFENGGTILVPSAQADLAKAQLVSQGYPKSGLTYDVFTTNIGMMTTDFERQSYLLFDLQDRIAGTIRYFDGVSDAIVTIAVGEEQRYVLQQEQTESSASVVVIMQNGGSPSADLVDGVVHLVANSVPGGLSEENITVLDGNGRAVNGTSGGSGYGVAQLKLSLENEINSSVHDELMHILGPIYGNGSVRVSVKSTVDVDKKIREYIEYIPATDDNRGVISGETHYTEIQRDGEDEEGGVPGAETNAEIPVYAGAVSDGTEIYFNDQSSIDYVVSQIKEQVQSDSGVLTDMMVSVAIDAVRPDATTQNEIRTLIARTAGIADENIGTNIALYYDSFAVADIQTQPDPIGDTLPWFFWYVVAGIGLALLIAIILVAVLRRRGRRDELPEDGWEQPQLEHTEGPPENYIMDIKLSDIKKTREQELKNQITDFADQNPEISAQLIKTWLKGVDTNEPTE